MKRISIVYMILLFGLLISQVIAQSGSATTTSSQFASLLTVDSVGVEVKRVDAQNWIPVRVETIIGVGDIVRTNEAGQATITFLNNGTQTQILPTTEFWIELLTSNGNDFAVEARIDVGQIVQRIEGMSDTDSSYVLQTPAMEISASNETEFDVRVEESKRSAVLVRDGNVNLTNEFATAVSSAGYGNISFSGEPLEDVVPATTYKELEDATYGCAASITLPDDLRINVRAAPHLDAMRVGTVDPADVNLFMGETETTNWYRIRFQGGFGWVLSSTAQISSDCSKLRPFPNDRGSEDVSLYNDDGEEGN